MARPGKPGLQAAIDRGEPLADFVITFAEGEDYAALTERLSRLADDLFVHDRPHYGMPAWRLAVATKTALEREFGWVLRRVPLPGGSNRGYWWEVAVEPKRVPDGLEGIAAMDLTQPGGDDLSQYYEWR